MAEQLIYREGATDDVPQLKSLGLTSYSRLAADLDWEAMKLFLEKDDLYHELLKTAYAFVCESAGVIVGMAYLVPHGNPTELFPAEWAYIRMVGVHPDYSGRGIAKQLTELCIEKARQTGEATIALHTSEVMRAARHIYENAGFKIEKAIPPRYGVPYHIYRLEL
ncbi:MAG: GNAT family N-acetyltransferase [Bacteroidia bacterium]